jgi:hypothetical protein
VLADMEAALVREAEKLFGASLKGRKPQPSREGSASMLDLVLDEKSDDAPLRKELHLTGRERRDLWHHVSTIDGFWESLEEIEPGTVERLATIAEERRREIIFLTRRPATAGATAQIQSQRWLEAKEFRLPSVYVVTASRGIIAAGLTLDIVVDDTPENCVDVAVDSKARTIAVFRTQEPPPPALHRMGIHLARSTDEALNLLVEIDASVERQPGALKRAMRMLGMQQTGST